MSGSIPDSYSELPEVNHFIGFINPKFRGSLIAVESWPELEYLVAFGCQLSGTLPTHANSSARRGVTLPELYTLLLHKIKYQVTLVLTLVLSTSISQQITSPAHSQHRRKDLWLHKRGSKVCSFLETACLEASPVVALSISVKQRQSASPGIDSL